MNEVFCLTLALLIVVGVICYLVWYRYHSFLHVDDWIDQPTNDEELRVVKYWLSHFRLPPEQRNETLLGRTAITCTYRGKRYRCVGCSRMGDVWLTSDLNATRGYEWRVNIRLCHDWRWATHSGELDPELQILDVETDEP